MHDKRRVEIVVDQTHMNRRASGLERITRELFSPAALAPLDVKHVSASGKRLSMIAAQTLWNPLAAVTQPRSIWIFPGYPPSPAFVLLRQRTLMYVHDLFLMTRQQDLNLAARLYMALPFRLALKRLRYFLTNSESTASQLAPYVASDAKILTYRPPAANVFDLRALSPSAKSAQPLIVGALGTIEPRKNFVAAAEICKQVATVARREVHLHIIGRRGWGGDYDKLTGSPHVRLHGFLEDSLARAVIQNFDIFLCTSLDEGLGLPLLEVQFAGIPVVAPDQRVFHEVLSQSGIYIEPSDPRRAAERIAALIQEPNWRERSAVRAESNLKRWNALADDDRRNVLVFLSALIDRHSGRNAVRPS